MEARPRFPLPMYILESEIVMSESEVECWTWSSSSALLEHSADEACPQNDGCEEWGLLLPALAEPLEKVLPMMQEDGVVEAEGRCSPSHGCQIWGEKLPVAIWDGLLVISRESELEPTPTGSVKCTAFWTLASKLNEPPPATGLHLERKPKSSVATLRWLH